MPDGGVGALVAVAARTAIVLLALVVGMRVLGRRQLGEMNVRDLLLVLVIANAVQNAMTKGDGSITVALTSAGALLLLGWGIAALTFRVPALEPYLKGTPAVLVRDGHLARRNLRRMRISVEELQAEARKQGVEELKDVELAVAEVDGSISIVPREHPEQD